ncbi:MAG: 23S rRNA (adenine(2503)-C(2))-methyltransferase RlmN [Acidobacteria bacterium]|nr:MAG: 23S rRNA (adenine(2503)-C(2))-methyltransferase RlmN [Acidobacteriota bacterium]
MTRKRNLFGLDRAGLERVMAELGEPAYRARQLYVWLYRRRARSLEAMTDLGKGLRSRLESQFEICWPAVASREHSRDGTIKYLFRLDGEATIESVFIPEERRRTICISTQAGCPLRCAFCLTGIAGYKRNLEPWEILGQVAAVMDETARLEKPWNVVVMGMGEPLLNYEATVRALRILMDPEGFAIAPKKLTLSTVGILPALEKLMAEPVRPNLAISLHAPEPGLRRRLMPIEGKYRLDDVIAAAQRYPIPRGGRVTYEYVLLKDVNDSPAHARQLARLLGGSRAKVNLIPLNPAAEIPFGAPAPEAVDAFAGVLAAAHVTVSVRRPRGQDILAACGQLHLRDATGGASGSRASAR